MRLARVLSAMGRVMIAAGVLILLFVAYQLWGTGIREAQAQDRLDKELSQKLADVPTVTAAPSAPSSTTTPETLPPSTAPPLADAPNEGDAIGRIEIEKIGLRAVVVQGVGVDSLKDGPGHYPDTPMPGQKGNASIAGHRTTYGAPFGSVDELVPGDKIEVTTVQGRFMYAVLAQADGSGHLIVSPNQVEVLDDAGDDRITLTACHPKYSASQRIVVVGVLQGEALPAPLIQPRAAPVEVGISGQQVPKPPAILWGLVCVAIWTGAWLLGKRWRRWPSYALALPFFLVALFFFFENFSRLLPANY
jgi:sortase A